MRKILLFSRKGRKVLGARKIFLPRTKNGIKEIWSPVFWTLCNLVKIILVRSTAIKETSMFEYSWRD